MSALIIFNSNDSSNPSTPDNCEFNLPQLQSSNLLRYNVIVDQVVLTNAVYPINATRGNNIVYFQENNDTGVTLQATILEDNYTGTAIATHLSSILTASSANGYSYTVSYNVSKKKLTFTEAGGNPFVIVTGPSSSHREIGWDVSTQTSFVTVATEGAQPVLLSGSQYLDLYSTLSTNNISTTSTGSLLMRIPLNVSFGEILTHSDFTGVSLSLNSDNISTVRFYLRDDRGKAFTIPSHFPVSYTLRMSTA